MAETNTSTKVCTWCKETKSLIDFSNDKNRKDGKHPHCKTCNSVRLKARYAANTAEYNARSKADYENNKEKYISIAKSWAAENKEKRREVVKAYAARNPEKRSNTQKNYRLANSGLYAEHFKARQQRKRNAMPQWANRESIKAIYRQCAWASRVTGVKHHVDHYYPLTSDIVCGLHCEYNLRILPATDNLSKGNKFLG